MVRKQNGGWVVVSEKGKRLSRVYNSRKAAQARLNEIEYFKRKGKNNAN